MRTFWTTVFGVALLVSAWHATVQAQSRGPSQQSSQSKKGNIYDGKWWLAIDPEERAGFIHGTGDCLTWVAHVKGFNATPEDVAKPITEYYKAHPANRGLIVIDVWRKVLSSALAARPDTPNGEVWKNPHWYLDGLWWMNSSDSVRAGFLEGYFWCLRTRVEQPTETYSRPISYYSDKIADYYLAHPKAYDQAVAVILSRYRDRTASKP